LSQELADLLSISFKEAKDEDGETYYDFDDRRNCRVVTLSKNLGLVNDRDMNFEDFAYDFEIRARRLSDWEAAEKACLEMGQSAFEKLKQTKRL
jgi:hypothetical protein